MSGRRVYELLPAGAPVPPGMTPHIPFRVRRSRYQQLPVYSDYKNGRTRILTKISKIDGDIVVSGTCVCTCVCMGVCMHVCVYVCVLYVRERESDVCM